MHFPGYLLRRIAVPLTVAMLLMALIAAWQHRRKAAPRSAPAGAYRVVTFAELSDFEYTIPEINTVPEEILARDGEKIAIEGYMIPLNMEGDAVRDFYLVLSRQQCCFGVAPRLNQCYLVSRSDGSTIPYYKDQVLTVQGVLLVRENIQRGVVQNLYSIGADAVFPSPGR